MTLTRTYLVAERARLAAQLAQLRQQLATAQQLPLAICRVEGQVAMLDQLLGPDRASATTVRPLRPAAAPPTVAPKD